MLINQWRDIVGTAVARREHGQGLAEYGLIITLIALVCVLAISAIGGSLSEMFNTVAAAF